MAPVIQAHFGGLFCGRWTPEGGGVVYKSEGFWPLPLERRRHGDGGRNVVEFHAGTLAIFASAKIRARPYLFTQLRKGVPLFAYSLLPRPRPSALRFLGNPRF